MRLTVFFLNLTLSNLNRFELKIIYIYEVIKKTIALR
jgi:hypothetical protein